MFSKILILSLVLFSFGCKKETKAVAAVSDGSLSLADLLGNPSTACITGGGHSGTTSRKQVYNFNADNTYTYYMTIVNSGTCQLGATELVKYYQNGTFAITGVASGATKIAFTITEQGMNSYDGTNVYPNYFNNTALCQTPALTMNGAGATVTNLSNRTCSAYATFPTNGSTYYNAFTKSGTTLTGNAGSLLWYPGTAATYPTTLNTSYIYP